MINEPHIIVPPEPAPAPPLILLPEHAGAPRRSMQYFSGVAALALMFFASASLTVAYLSSPGQIASAASQTAAAAPATVEDPFASISLAAESVYVLDLTTNRVLYSKNPDSQLPLASLVKVPLVLAVSEAFEPASVITIPPHSTPDGAGIRLPSGLRFTAQDLIGFTLAASSNEGAAILAEAAEETLRSKYPLSTPGAAALWRMNDIAKNLGLSNMVFRSTNGLDQSDTQAGAYGSAHDVALLFAYAAKTAPAPFGQTSRDTIKIRATTGETVTAANTDEALPAIPGLIMGKTGYTGLAGGNLAIVFEVGPAHPVVAVVMHSTQDGRFSDMKKLVAATVAAIAAGQ
ncbi:D-alanyl-D-alanine carboxypeptidase [Candidatus Kaiserbacteria bacterium]|nr:D-alanyl-D-alanine carboxypeptidase [Candidatus Kaiserbacteria bacterium]